MRSMDSYQTFDNLVIQRQIQILSRLNGGRHHCAGPVYPAFESQGEARHWRGTGPADDCPPLPPRRLVRRLEEEFVYGGCLTRHFGHFLAEFVHRILPSVLRFPDFRMLFIGNPKVMPDGPPAFAMEVFRYFGVEDRVLVVNQPVQVQRLHVFAQQEWLEGPPPSPAYLAALTTLQQQRFPALQRSEQVLFVSRAKQSKGFAGERVLDELFEAAGARVYHPELHSLHEQLSTYLSHRRLLFSEGSALHALQLLGHVDAEVTVLSRRPGTMGAEFLTPRVRTLAYVAVGGAMVAWFTPRGLRAVWASLTFLRPGLLEKFCKAYFPGWPLRYRQTAIRRAKDQLHAAEAQSLEAYLDRLSPELLAEQAPAICRQIVGLERFSAQELDGFARKMRPQDAPETWMEKGVKPKGQAHDPGTGD